MPIKNSLQFTYRFNTLSNMIVADKSIPLHY